MLKKTLRCSKLSPDTLDRVKIGVMLGRRATRMSTHCRLVKCVHSYCASIACKLYNVCLCTVDCRILYNACGHTE